MNRHDYKIPNEPLTPAELDECRQEWNRVLESRFVELMTLLGQTAKGDLRKTRFFLEIAIGSTLAELKSVADYWEPTRFREMTLADFGAEQVTQLIDSMRAYDRRAKRIKALLP